MLPSEDCSSIFFPDSFFGRAKTKRDFPNSHGDHRWRSTTNITEEAQVTILCSLAVRPSGPKFVNLEIVLELKISGYNSPGI